MKFSQNEQNMLIKRQKKGMNYVQVIEGEGNLIIYILHLISNNFSLNFTEKKFHSNIFPLFIIAEKSVKYV